MKNFSELKVMNKFKIYVNICKYVYVEYIIEQIVFKYKSLNKREHKLTFLESIKTFLVLRLKKLRFEHFEIHTQTVKTSKLCSFEFYVLATEL